MTHTLFPKGHHNRLIHSFCLFVLSLLLSGCMETPQTSIKIAINPWPGYEFLYLAEQKGYFEEEGANIDIIQLESLADAQRAYTSNRVDGLASTLIEAVQAEHLGGKPLSVVLIADYSNGGDVVVAGTEYTDIASLKGKTVGCEVSSLGLFVLQRALNNAGMTLDDVTIINTEQSEGLSSLSEGKIDAFVTYPPSSIEILKHEQYQKIFDSSEIPFEIVDTLSISNSVLEQKPQLPAKIHRAWQKALDFTQANPEEAYNLMAKREGISAAEFQDVLSDLVVLSYEDQQPLFEKQQQFENSVQAVCEALVHAGALQIDCQQQKPLLWQGGI